jgi:DNA-directed RNA polymerase specialized sigma24 family protein
MTTASTNFSDEDLRAAIQRGLAASALLEARFRQPLERFLAGMCDRHDGRSQEKAVEIASQTLADCFMKSPSLLERWQGGENLEAFLRTVAAHKLKSWWRSRDAGTQVDTGGEEFSKAPALAAPAGDEDEIASATAALRAAVAAAEISAPEGVVFMRLKGLFGVDQRKLSACWGHHEAQTSRRIKEAMSLIRSRAMAIAADRCEFTAEVLQRALHRDPSLLLGTGAGGGLPDGEQLLLRVAAGGADDPARAQAVRRMLANEANLAFFARLLNRPERGCGTLVRDPALDGAGARLRECVCRSMRLLAPAEVAGMFTPLMRACFADMLAHLGADGGTLWLRCPEGEALEAVYNPREPEIIGRRQPLLSGIISLVLATGEPLAVASAADHVRHSPAIDVALGKTTQAMLAVPFVVAGVSSGVLTAVRWSRESAFAAEDLTIVSHHAEILARLLEAALTERILA